MLQWIEEFPKDKSDKTNGGKKYKAIKELVHRVHNNFN
jgi:hypothetical protein